MTTIEREPRKTFQEAQAIHGFYLGKAVEMGENREIYLDNLKQIEQKLEFFKPKFNQAPGKLAFYPPVRRHFQEILFTSGNQSQDPKITWILEREAGRVLPRSIKTVSFTTQEGKPVLTITLQKFPDHKSIRPTAWTIVEITAKETARVKTESLDLEVPVMEALTKYK